jgi:predicted metal-dependent enzyme (double-stranded beta helix superfamily)
MSSLAFTTFVRDAERLIDDPHAIAERLETLLAADGWLAPEHQLPSPDTYRQHLLHVSDCRRLSVVALVWLPGQRTPIHDHVSWCVVGVYRGVERETHYRLIERDGERCLLPVRAVEARAGHVEALVPPAENIHSVEAAGPHTTISIHVYGADIERLGSSILRRFDDLRRLPPRRRHPVGRTGAPRQSRPGPVTRRLPSGVRT